MKAPLLGFMHQVAEDGTLIIQALAAAGVLTECMEANAALGVPFLYSTASPWFIGSKVILSGDDKQVAGVVKREVSRQEAARIWSRIPQWELPPAVHIYEIQFD